MPTLTQHIHNPAVNQADCTVAVYYASNTHVRCHPVGIVQFRIEIIEFLGKGNTGTRRKRQASSNIIEAVCCLCCTAHMDL